MQGWLVILLKSVSLFIVTIALIRIIGNRHPTKSTPFFYVKYAIMAIIIADMSAGVIKNMAYGLIALGVWFLLGIAIEYLSLKSHWIHDVLFGKSIVLVKHGKVMEENLMQERITGEDLLRDLRTRNVFKFADVEFAMLEPSGDLNVLLKTEQQPLTPYAIGQKVSPQNAPQTVILDGNIMDEALTNLGLNRGWLTAQLEALGVPIENVFIGQVDSSGDVYLDLFDDNIQLPQPKVKELLFANLEKTYADLTSFALETKNQKAKAMYQQNAKKLNQLIKDLEPYLLR